MRAMFILIALALAFSYLDYSVRAIETIDFAALEVDVKQRVEDLLSTGKYDLKFYTDFKWGPGRTWNNKTSQGMVVSDDPRCSQTGAYYLLNGGNAIDAAVATALCLSVVNVGSSGIAGGGLSLTYVNGRFNILDFRPNVTKTLISNENITVNGTGEAVKIPSLIMGLHNLWLQGGKIEWKTLFDIPILIAYSGWNLKPNLHYMIKARRKLLYNDEFLREMLLNGTQPKAFYEYLVNKPLAGTLHLISLNYRNMYEGAIPSIMMKQISKDNHAALVSEIGAYTTRNMDPLKYDLNDNQEMVTTPQTTGGPLLVYILNAMKGFLSRHPNVVQPRHPTNISYFATLYDIIKSVHRLTEYLAGENALQVIENAYYKFNESTPTVKRIINTISSLEDEIDEDSDDIAGSVGLNVVDRCGNVVSMQNAINTLFGGNFTYPSLGIVANTFTHLKIGEDLKPIEPSINHRKGYYAPTIVIDKTSKEVSGAFTGTGARKIPEVIAQVMMNHYFRNLNLGTSIGIFRMFAHRPTNRVPIPQDIREYLIAARNVTINRLPMGHDTSALGIRITRDENGFPESIFGMSDHRRNGGVMGI